MLNLGRETLASCAKEAFEFELVGDPLYAPGELRFEPLVAHPVGGARYAERTDDTAVRVGYGDTDRFTPASLSLVVARGTRSVIARRSSNGCSRPVLVFSVALGSSHWSMFRSTVASGKRDSIAFPTAGWWRQNGLPTIE